MQGFRCLSALAHGKVPQKPEKQTLRVQVPNNHILTLNLYYNYYYPNPKYLIIGYMDPLGKDMWGPGRRSKYPARFRV